MGMLACDAIDNDNNLTLAGRATRETNLRESIKNTKADIVVDLTDANSVDENIEIILESGSNAIIGTSGISEQARKKAEKIALANNLRCLIVPNFSIGAALMMQFAAKAAPYFTDVEIIERHHNQKIDFPSGTAIRTAELISQNKCDVNASKEEKNIIPNTTRGSRINNISIHSLRMLGSVAHQSVIFSNLHESLNITHDTSNRLCFMPGIILACKNLMNLTPGLNIGLEQVMPL